MAKDEPDLPPDFKSFLNVVSSESKVSFQDYLTALSKLGILEAPDQSRDYSHLLVAKQIADRDNAVRSAALNCIVHAYCQEGEKVYKLIGQVIYLCGN